MKILDVSAGNRAMWFNPTNPYTVFVDIRPETTPDLVVDSRGQLPFEDDEFDLAVFDPPHVNFGATAELSKTYGWHTTEEIRDIIRRTSPQLARVLRPDGLLCFKWNDHSQKLDTVLALLTHFEPLFGQRTSWKSYESITKRGTRKKICGTFWVVLRVKK